MSIYLVMLTVTGTLLPVSFIMIGVSFLDAMKFTLISHVMALVMLVVMSLFNLL